MESKDHDMNETSYNEVEDLKTKVAHSEKVHASMDASHASEVKILNNSIEAMQEASTRMVEKLEGDIVIKDTFITTLEADNENLKEELNRVKIELEMVKAVSDILPPKVEKLTQELDHANSLREKDFSLIDELEKKYAHSESTIKSLEDRLMTSEESSLSIKNENLELKEENKSLSKTLEKRRSEVEGYQVNLNELKDLNVNIVEKLQNDLSSIETERNSLRELNKSLLEKLTTFQSDKKDLEKQVAEMSNNLAVTKEKLTYTSDDNLALIANFSKLESKLKTLRDARDALSAKNDELSKEVDQLTNNLDTDRKALNESKNNYEYLEEKHHAFKKAYGSEMSMLKQKLSNLSSKNASLEETVKTLKNDCEKKVTKIRNLQESAEMNAQSQEESMKKKENAMMKENELLKADIMNLRNELENSLSRCEEQESALQERIKNANEKNDEIISSLRSDLEKMNKDMEEEVATLTSRYEEELENVKTSNSSLLDEIDALKQSRDSDLASIVDDKANLEHLKEELHTSRNDLSNLQKLFEDEKSRYEQLEVDSKSEAESLRANLVAEIESKERKTRELEEKLATLTKDHEEEISKLTAKIDSLTETERNLSNELETMKNTISSNAVEMLNLQNGTDEKLEEMKQELATKQTTYDQDVLELNENIKLLNEKEQKLRNEIEEKELLISEHSKEMWNLQNLLETETKRSKNLETELTSKIAECKKCKTQCDHLKDDLGSHEELQKKYHSEVSLLKERIISLGEELSNSQKSCEVLKKANTELEKRIVSLKSIIEKKSIYNDIELTHKNIQPVLGKDKRTIITETLKSMEDSMTPLGSASAKLIGSPKNITDLVIPEENEDMTKPPALVDIIDALTSNKWKSIKLMNVTEKALRTFLSTNPEESNLITGNSIRLFSVDEFSSKKQYWYATLTVDKHLFDPSVPLEQEIQFACGLAGRRMGRIVYYSKEYAIDALLFFILKQVDPSGKWINEFLSARDRSCLLRKVGSHRTTPWAALIRKGGRVFLADLREGKAEKGLVYKSVLMGRRESIAAQEERKP